MAWCAMSLGLAGAILVACSTSNPNAGATNDGKQSCLPGQQTTCTCTGGGTGFQVCDPTGASLGSCQCSSSGGTANDAAGSADTANAPDDIDSGVNDSGANDSGANDSGTGDAGGDADAGFKGCDPFINGDFKGNCEGCTYNPYCYDFYGAGGPGAGPPGIQCPVANNCIYTGNVHCPSTELGNNTIPLGMKCAVPSTTGVGCTTIYAYGDYGPAMKSMCDGQHGTVVYP
jgi:hypothetical protein